MVQNIIVAILGAIGGGIILFFALGIPAEIDYIDRRVTTLEGKVVVFTALRRDFEKLQNRVKTVQEGLSKGGTT